jgi:hypothetical protein
MSKTLPTLSKLVALAAIASVAALSTATASATAPPIGPLPAGPTSLIHTQPGQLVAVALPHRAGGRVWRIARGIDAQRLRQVSEADVGSSVVLVFEALRTGTARVAFGLTRGERTKAYESRQFVVEIVS